ncbi:MAG: hypothetical protein LBS36_12370 [Oscillospiraceae bacterium]|jgi:beta-lactamase regulating signal transducer with metallopeptidase domain|nr:hypothetical protein [Oscillospiraceae bacterium]
METIFETVLTMSLKASAVLLIVLAARLLLKNAPRKYSYVLWAVVLFRLVCPFSPELSFGALDFSGVDQSIETAREAINTGADEGLRFDAFAGTPGLGKNTSPGTSSPSLSGGTAANASGAAGGLSATLVLSMVWLAGVAAMLGMGAVSYRRLKKKLTTATLVSGNVFESGRIGTAFVTGLFRPKIYLPLGLDGPEREYVLAHERMHVRHGDNIAKFAAYLALAVHWFNPLVWAAFTLMAKDMEMKCDEAVVEKLGSGIVRDYGQSILALAVNRRFPVPNPLAFGESNTKQRVKNIMNYKKPAFWVIAGALAVCLAVGVFGIIERKPVQDNTPPPAVGNEEDNTAQNGTSEQPAGETTTEQTAKQNQTANQATTKAAEKTTGKAISLPANFTGGDIVSAISNGSATVSEKTLKQMLMFFPLSRGGSAINWNSLTLDNVLECFFNMTYVYSETASPYDEASGYAGNLALSRQIAGDVRQYENQGNSFTAAYTLDEFNANIKKIYGKNAGTLTKEKLLALETQNSHGDFVKYVKSVDGIAIFFGGRGLELSSYYPYQIQKAQNGYVVDALNNYNLNEMPDTINDFKNTSTDMLLSMRKNRLADIINSELTAAKYKSAVKSATTLDGLVSALAAGEYLSHVRFTFGQNADGSLYIISKTVL